MLNAFGGQRHRGAGGRHRWAISSCSSARPSPAMPSPMCRICSALPAPCCFGHSGDLGAGGFILIAGCLGMGVLGERTQRAGRRHRRSALALSSASACCSCISTHGLCNPGDGAALRQCAGVSIARPLSGTLAPSPSSSSAGLGADRPGRCSSPACSRSWRRRRASRCSSSRCCSWRSWHSPSPNAPRSSACCWCSR